jgi:hypothetical protein
MGHFCPAKPTRAIFACLIPLAHSGASLPAAIFLSLLALAERSSSSFFQSQPVASARELLLESCHLPHPSLVATVAVGARRQWQGRAAAVAGGGPLPRPRSRRRRCQGRSSLAPMLATVVVARGGAPPARAWRRWPGELPRACCRGRGGRGRSSPEPMLAMAVVARARAPPRLHVVVVAGARRAGAAAAMAREGGGAMARGGGRAMASSMPIECLMKCQREVRGVRSP